MGKVHPMLNALVKGICKLLSNTTLKDYDQRKWQDQWFYVKKLWNKRSFGLLRIFQLFLSLIRYLDITYWAIRLCREAKPPRRQLVNEAIVLVRGLILVLILFCADSRSYIFRAAVIYLLATTVFHLLAVVFLGEIYPRPISILRSQLFVLWHYVEVTVGFAFLYLAYGDFRRPICAAQSLYFSFGTSATVGYGDFTPINPLGQRIVVFQILTMLIFVTVVFTYFSTRSAGKGKKLVRRRFVRKRGADSR
jgi:hypothetical protein